MNNPLSLQKRIRPVRKAACLGLLGALGLWLGTSDSSAQTTIASDVAADPAYSGAGAPNGLSPGGQNGGFGFGPWTFTVQGNGGAFIAGSGPSGASFDLWNTGGNASTIAVRPFSSPLSPGQSFSVQLRLNSLDGTSNTNALVLQDASGNTLFSYYHVGKDNLDGHYTDATTSNGIAPNFRYDYQQFDSFSFTLNSPTTYVFTDNTTGASISGSISGGPIAQVAFVRANGNPTGNGQDFQFDSLTITSSDQVAPPAFQQQTPAAGAFSVAANTPVTVQVVPGGVPLKTGSLVMRVDGAQVTPTVTTAQSILNVSYQPGVAFGVGTKHTAQVVVTDNNNTAYTNTWSFTIGFSSLPVVLSGPVAVSNGNEVVIATAAGEGWLGTNYNTNSSRTLYSRFSMTFHDLNGETGSGGGYGGLHFFQDNDARLLVGNGWTSLNWSLDAAADQRDLSPALPVVLDEWHTMVVRTDYTPGGNASVKIWLDPDFTQTEANQPNAPLTLTKDVTFNNIRLRCGNGTANAEFTNIVLAATASGVGFAVPAAPQFQRQSPAPGSFSVAVTPPISVQVVPGGVPLDASSISLRVDGSLVAPTLSTAQGIITVNYQPATPLSQGSTHTAEIAVKDTANTAFTNAWSFMTGFDALPVTLPGPISVGNGNAVQIFNAATDAWLGTNYNSSSSRTLYSRFSMAFHDLNGESGSGGGYGGFQFFQDNNERLLVGNAWASLAWSLDAAGNQLDLLPWIAVVLDEWHTMVVRTDYTPGGNASVTVWLDPDFTQTEANQPNTPLTLMADAAFNNIRLRCGNGTANAEFTNIVLAATAAGVGFAVPAAPQFQGFVPAMNAASATPSTVVKVDVVVGGVSIPTKNITMDLDGVAVKPVCSVSGNIITVNYQPAVPFEPGSFHFVNVNLTDANGTPFSTGWTFVVDSYPRLPLTLAGPYDVSGGGGGITLFNNQNGWIGSNYGANSTNTLYTRFSITFNDLNGETGSGGGFGGLQFFQGNSEGVIVGNNWGSLNWGYDAFGDQQDLVPAVPVVLGEWHTLVVKQQFVPGASARFSIWLDPDFTRTEGNQPQAPTTFGANGLFDNVRLRCGNGSASAQFTNVVMAATATGVGFVAQPAPAQLSIQPSGGNITLSWTSSGKLQEATAVNGPWKDSADQSNPQTRPTSSSAMFFRLLQ